MSVNDFFGLLRAHVPATRLQALLGALAQFNAKRMSADELSATAAAVLRPSPAELAAAGLPPAPMDLLSAFEAYMRK